MKTFLLSVLLLMTTSSFAATTPAKFVQMYWSWCYG